MRKVPILADNYYHIYNRGDQKQQLFFSDRDYIRFLFLILHLQAPVSFRNINRRVDAFQKKGDFGVKKSDLAEIISNRQVELVNFNIMPNHVHLTLHNLCEAGVSEYMHRVTTAYAMHFNTKYDRTGHVFQGRFKVKLVTDDAYLHQLSAYIHNNAKDLKKWHGKEKEYPWSSYTDYENNRWGELLKPGVVMETFKDFEEYQEYVESCHFEEGEEEM